MKKARQYRLLKKRLDEYGLERVFHHMGSLLKDIKVDSSEGVDITDRINQVGQDTMIKLLLGKALNDTNLFQQWFGNSFKVIKELDPNYGSKDDFYRELHVKMLAFIRSTPVGQALGDVENKEELENELIHYVMWLSTGGIELSFKSALNFFSNLDKEIQEEMTEEAEEFLDECEYKKNFKFYLKKKLPVISRFALEAFRLEPAAANLRAQARKDFVVTSLNGRYLIKKGTYLQGNVLTIQRNPEIFKDGTEFNIERNQRKVKRNFFTFGGPYYQRPKIRNRKCLGQELAINFLKMFMLHITQCEVEVDSIVSTSTGKTGEYIIKVNKFQC